VKRRGRRREPPRRRAAPRTADRWIVPLVVAVVTLLAFVPVFQNDFVD